MGLNTLQQVGEFLNLPKLDHAEDFLQYNRRDVEILVAFWNWLQKQGISYLTLAAESRFRMAQDLRQNLGLRAIYSDKEISDMLKYYGGRTEAYYAHAENAYDLDVNSL